MSRRISAFIGFGVALALTVLVFALGRAGQVPLVWAVVTTQTIPQDTPIAAGWVKLVAIPETAFQKGMVGALKEAVGQYAAYPMPAGTYVTAQDVEALPLRDGLCAGEVGITVPIQSASQAVGIYPGMYVNVVHATVANTASSPTSLRAGGAGEPGLIEAGVRVIAVANASGGLITGPQYASQEAQVSGLTLSGSNVPAMVELAIPASEQGVFAQALSSGGVSMAPAPWLAPPQPSAVCAGASGSAIGGTEATPGAPSGATAAKGRMPVVGAAATKKGKTGR